MSVLRLLGDRLRPNRRTIRRAEGWKPLLSGTGEQLERSMFLPDAPTGIEARLSGTAPIPSGGIAANHGVSATVSGTAPIPSGSIDANHGVSATVSGTAPIPSGSIEAAFASTVTGTLTGTAPIPTGSINAAHGVSATVSGTAPIPAGTINAAHGVSASISGTTPIPTGTINVSNLWLRTDQAVYTAQATVVATYSGYPVGSLFNWIALAVVGSPPDVYLQWSYLFGSTEGTFTFLNVSPGTYEVRAYYDWPAGGFTIQGTSAQFQVVPLQTVTPNSTTVPVTGGVPTVNFTVTPNATTIPVTGGVPTVNFTVTPNATTVPVTGGVPDVSQTNPGLTVTPISTTVPITGGVAVALLLDGNQINQGATASCPEGTPTESTLDGSSTRATTETQYTRAL